MAHARVRLGGLAGAGGQQQRARGVGTLGVVVLFLARQRVACGICSQCRKTSAALPCRRSSFGLLVNLPCGSSLSLLVYSCRGKAGKATAASARFLHRLIESPDFGRRLLDMHRWPRIQFLNFIQFPPLPSDRVAGLSTAAQSSLTTCMLSSCAKSTLGAGRIDVVM